MSLFSKQEAFQFFSDNRKQLRRAAGYGSPACLKAMIILGISLLAAAVITAAVVTPLMILKSPSTTTAGMKLLI